MTKQEVQRCDFYFLAQVLAEHSMGRPLAEVLDYAKEVGYRPKEVSNIAIAIGGFNARIAHGAAKRSGASA